MINVPILGVRVPRSLPDFSNPIGMPETIGLLPIMPIGPPGAMVLQSGVHLRLSIVLFPKTIRTIWYSSLIHSVLTWTLMYTVSEPRRFVRVRVCHRTRFPLRQMVWGFVPWLWPSERCICHGRCSRKLSYFSTFQSDSSMHECYFRSNVDSGCTTLVNVSIVASFRVSWLAKWLMSMQLMPRSWATSAG